MKTYSEKLKSADWQKRRDEILTRDKRQCAICGNLDGPQVHHLRYVKGKEPWEYPNEALVTLCAGHHSMIHDESRRSKAENILIHSLKFAKFNSCEILELTALCLAHKTQFAEKIENAAAR